MIPLDPGHEAALALHNFNVGFFHVGVDHDKAFQHVTDLVGKEVASFTSSPDYRMFAASVTQLRQTREELAALSQEEAQLRQQYEAALIAGDYDAAERKLSDCKRRLGLLEERAARLSAIESQQRPPLEKAWRDRMQAARADARKAMCGAVWSKALEVKAKMAALLTDYLALAAPLNLLESPQSPLASCNPGGMAAMPRP